MLCAAVAIALVACAEPPEFNRDVRPILADACFRCHGPDSAARKRGLRLDTPDGAMATLASGLRAIVPGDSAGSELIRRISSTDPDEVMPPPRMNHAISSAQRRTLAAWIDGGAVYEPHWAFTPPRAVTAPAVSDQAWCRDPIDAFVLASIDKAGLAHGPDADAPTLLRRVSLALTGLPPTRDDMEAFAEDKAPGAYERQVDRLLASPHFGERMASDWLDVARYADTFGYQSDWECRVWPWRDWVIGAFNTNTPYDRFIEEQLAGDLEPDATSAQRIATAFNRLHRQTNEGGSIDDEFRQEYVSDRVHTYGTAFLGLTVECARCHDHKYDPIPQSDYYSLGAYFGAINESGTYPYSTSATPRPALRLLTPEIEGDVRRQAAAVSERETALADARAHASERMQRWLSEGAVTAGMAPPLKRYALAGEVDGPNGKATLLDGDSGPSFKDAPAWRRCDPRSLVFWMKTPDLKARATIIHTSVFTIESDQQGYQVMLKDGRLCWEIIHLWPGSAISIRSAEPLPLNRWVNVGVTYDGSSRAAGLHIYLDGRPAAVEVVEDHLDGPATVRSFEVGFRSRDHGFKGGSIAEISLFDRELSALEINEIATPGSIELALHAAAGNKTPEHGGQPPISPLVQEFYALAVDPEIRAEEAALREARARYQAALEAIPELMVMEESPHAREQFVLTRGQYDQPDRARPVRADRAIPAVFAMDSRWPHNRMGLAKWTIDPDNPLTARVAVNRLWALCFGRGIVASVENLGLQGDPPTHPELLDTLAVDFVRDGWNVKSLLRRIVCSSTFRQASTITDAGLQRDPQNALYSHGPIMRLSAESLRDQALLASGLLSEELGGPSVKPWQPPGLWEDSGVSSQGAYVPDTGAKAHRRSLYTYRKRTAPPPNMTAFDAGSGEKCLARRQPTNTPLQPLVLMNDPVFTECARALAERVLKEDVTLERRIALAFRLLVSREPRAGEMAPLVELYRSSLATTAPDAEAAAMTLVCSTILASDAAMTSR